jgi:hypothetical protein
MLTLCAACHARVERTKFLAQDVSNLVRELWRELHPHGPEQALRFWPQANDAVTQGEGGGFILSASLAKRPQREGCVATLVAVAGSLKRR